MDHVLCKNDYIQGFLSMAQQMSSHGILASPHFFEATPKFTIPYLLICLQIVNALFVNTFEIQLGVLFTKHFVMLIRYLSMS